jgi:hypothetical protein
VVNAERAWIMAELVWQSHKRPPLMLGASQGVSGVPVLSTNVGIQLKCKNEGRTPGWIYEVRGHMEIVSAESASITKLPENLEVIHGLGGAIGSDSYRERYVEFNCSGHLKSPQLLSLYVVVRYHDIFGTERETRIAYAIDSRNNIYLQDALTERNKNL